MQWKSIGESKNMPITEHRVSWDAVLYIWLDELARVFVFNGCMLLGSKVLSWLTPVLYSDLLYFDSHNETISLCFKLLFEWWILLWCLREALTNHYTTFRIDVVVKETGLSLMTLKKLPWFVIISVWWAQTWRTLLVPAAVVGGCFLALMMKYPTASYYHLLNPTFLNINLYACLVFSFWGMWAALGDRYWSYRFVSKPQQLYTPKEGPLG